MNDENRIFNRALLRKRRNRAAGAWGEHAFLKREASERMAERISLFRRSFDRVLDLGCHAGELAGALKGGDIITCDLAEAMRPQIVCDEELLPFAEHSFDLVASALSLHHVNDLPGALIQVRHCLKPGGLFMAVLFGASTLKELQWSLGGAAAEHGFALSPRVSPFVEVRDAGGLLQRAGFAEPVADSESLTVEYDNVHKLMQELRAMGEANLLNARRKSFTPRSHMAAIMDYYHTHYAQDCIIPATVEFVTMTAWKP